MKNKQFNCFSMRMAGYLMLHGVVLHQIEKCKDSRRNIFMFKDSEYLQELILQYKEEKHRFVK